MQLQLGEITGVHPSLKTIWDLITHAQYFLRPLRDLDADQIDILFRKNPITVTLYRDKYYAISDLRIYALALATLDQSSKLDVCVTDVAIFDSSETVHNEYLRHLIYAANAKEIAFLCHEISKIDAGIVTTKTIDILGLSKDQIKNRKLKPSELQIFYQKIKQQAGVEI